jgi:hypothetical protein
LNRIALACAAAALAGTAAFVPPASAEDCYGLNAARVCATVYPKNRPDVYQEGEIAECVHVGATCQPVSVPILHVRPGGPLVEAECYVGDQTCFEFVQPLLPTSAAEPGR